MDNLQAIYKRISRLRQSGVRMKAMAEAAGMAPSVFSALYATVLPAYEKNIEKGLGPDEALNEALAWVNNVSKKRLIESLPALQAALSAIEPPQAPSGTDPGNPYPALLAHLMEGAAERLGALAGCYMSYSLSSGSKCMKLEPYLLRRRPDGRYVEVIHRSAYGTTHNGFAIMNGLNHLYLFFNENKAPQATFFDIFLKLPLYERPPFLRGLYTCLDYNYNPIARRILFVRRSEGTDAADLDALEGGLKPREALSQEELAYFDYTCGPADALRMCTPPTPGMTPDDLRLEKRLLDTLAAE